MTKAAFSIQDFSASYGISRSQTYKEINAGRLIAKKYGDRTLISAQDANNWLNAGKRMPVPENAA